MSRSLCGLGERAPLAVPPRTQPAGTRAQQPDRGQPESLVAVGAVRQGTPRGEPAGAEVASQLADRRSDAKSAFNFAILLEEGGDEIGAPRAYQRAEQLGHPEIADMARVAALDLTKQIKSPIAVGKAGGHDGPGWAPSPWRAGPLLVLAASVLVLVLVPAFASARTLGPSNRNPRTPVSTNAPSPTLAGSTDACPHCRSRSYY